MGDAPFGTWNYLLWFIQSMIPPTDNVLRTVLALFMEDEVLPLPTLEEVLICNSTTTAEEVSSISKKL